MDLSNTYIHQITAQLKLPAIVQVVKAVPEDCTFLRAAKLGETQYIFPLPVGRAKEFFPLIGGLEKMFDIPDAKEKDLLAHLFFKYPGSTKYFDVAVTYRKSDGQPSMVYHARGNIRYDEKREVHIPEPVDLIFYLKKNGIDVRKNLGLDELKNAVIKGIFTCNAGERSIWEEQIKKNLKGQKTK
ncbi:hypothetical protein HYX04_04575 [Candidatus Woesearchaeota archaeon]|nr:hypothetical protein [Candidatus Woesearchaeota archaeon]